MLADLQEQAYIFAFDLMPDSYFYRVGSTDLMLCQFLFVSIAYQGSAVVAYRTGVFLPDLKRIALLFGGGVILDSLAPDWQFRQTSYFKVARRHVAAIEG